MKENVGKSIYNLVAGRIKMLSMSGHTITGLQQINQIFITMKPIYQRKTCKRAQMKEGDARGFLNTSTISLSLHQQRWLFSCLLGGTLADEDIRRDRGRLLVVPASCNCYSCGPAARG